jgi:hypothetical protein
LHIGKKRVEMLLHYKMMGVAAPTIYNLDDASRARKKEEKLKTFSRKESGNHPQTGRKCPWVSNSSAPPTPKCLLPLRSSARSSQLILKRKAPRLVLNRLFISWYQKR